MATEIAPVEAPELDLDAYYRVAEYGDIAFHVLSYAVSIEPNYFEGGEEDEDDEPVLSVEFEEVENRDWVRAVMVGDDTVHMVEVTDLTPLPEDEHVCSCGQLGCGW